MYGTSAYTFRDYLLEEYAKWVALNPDRETRGQWNPKFTLGALKVKITGFVSAAMNTLKTPAMKICIANSFATDGRFALIRSDEKQGLDLYELLFSRISTSSKVLAKTQSECADATRMCCPHAFYRILSTSHQTSSATRSLAAILNFLTIRQTTESHPDLVNQINTSHQHVQLPCTLDTFACRTSTPRRISSPYAPTNMTPSRNASSAAILISATSTRFNCKQQSKHTQSP